MHPPAPLPFQVAFLSGQSNPPGAVLSPEQTRFLAALPVPDAARMPRNFPYPATMAGEQFARPPLLVASARNGWQYFASRRPEFAEQHRPAVEKFLAGAEHTLLLAGSCGLELFNNLALSARTLECVTILAYGPVARRRPDCACVLVQGRSDWISRRYFPAVDVRVEAGHMDYLAVPAVLALATQTVRRLATQPEQGHAGAR